MTTKTKIIIGLTVLAAGAAAYYFLVYKPKQKASAQKTGTAAATPTKAEILAGAGSTEAPQVINTATA